MGNHQCFGTEFRRWGKHWSWCSYDGTIYESQPSQERCQHCERQWRACPGFPEEIKRIQDYIDRQVDFPYYKVRTAELEAALADLRQASYLAVAGMNRLAHEEAKRKGTKYEDCDYPFAKALRAVLKSSEVQG